MEQCELKAKLKPRSDQTFALQCPACALDAVLRELSCAAKPSLRQLCRAIIINYAQTTEKARDDRD